MIKNRNIMVTGGAGFIGSHIVEILLEAGNFVLIFDNFNSYYEGKETTIKEITDKYTENKDYRIIKADLTDKSALDKIEEEIEIIFNLAAQPGVRFSLQHPGQISNINIVSTVNILDYAVQNNIKRVIQASSSSVYGNPIYTPLDEEHPKAPISPYAVSKLCCELYCDYYYREYGLSTSSLRFYTVYGPRGRPDMAIRKFFNLIMNGKEITIYGDGEQMRDFTYVSDIVNGLILAAEKKEAIGNVFNLGYSNPITVNDLIDKMYQITNATRKIKYGEKKKGDVDITYSDTTKAKKILDYHPKVDIDTGLRKTYDWHLRITN